MFSIPLTFQIGIDSLTKHMNLISKDKTKNGFLYFIYEVENLWVFM